MSDVILALIGTRQAIPAVNADITRTMEALDREIIIASGDASGVDAHVYREIKRLGFRFVRFYARRVNDKWPHPGVGPERNTLIARFAQSVIAWPASPEFPESEREKSSGSWGCVDLFRERGKPVDVRDVAWR